MGNCIGPASREYRLELEKSKEIDQELARARSSYQRILHIRIGGSREGSTAFMKQLRTQFPLDWPLLSEAEREERRQQVFHFIVHQLAVLLAIVQSAEDGEVEGMQRVYDIHNSGMTIEMNAELLECLTGAWEDAKVQAALEQHRGVEGTFEDLEYFMNNADRVLQHDSIVSIEDWRHVKQESRGLVSYKLSTHGSLFEIHDTTRLGCEARKWQEMFGDVHGVVFLVPINEFDQTLHEDSRINVIQEYIDLFNQTVNCSAHRQTSCYLIFTNISLFREKLQIMPIKVEDPLNPDQNRWTDYDFVEGMSETATQAEEGVDQGIQYFRNKFMEVVLDLNLREVMFYILDIEDTQMFRHVLEAAATRVLMAGLNNVWFDPAWGP